MPVTWQVSVFHRLRQKHHGLLELLKTKTLSSGTSWLAHGSVKLVKCFSDSSFRSVLYPIVPFNYSYHCIAWNEYVWWGGWKQPCLGEVKWNSVDRFLAKDYANLPLKVFFNHRTFPYGHKRQAWSRLVGYVLHRLLFKARETWHPQYNLQGCERFK